MSTEMVRADQANTSLTIFAGSDPLTFADRVGEMLYKARVGGCDKKEEAQVLALACYSRGMDPFTLCQTFHIVDGKLSMRADAMLAKIRMGGGEFRWLKDGSDGTAEIEVTWRGQTVRQSFSMEDAHRAKLVKAGGAWEKTPANMLRARVTSNACRMIAPEIVAGFYTPEELGDEPKPAGQRVVDRLEDHLDGEHDRVTRIPKTVVETEESRQAEVEHTPDVIDAEHEPVAAEAPEPAPAPAPEPTVYEQDRTQFEIDALLMRLEDTRENIEETLRKQNPAFKTIADLAPEKARALADNLQRMVDAKLGPPHSEMSGKK